MNRAYQSSLLIIIIKYLLIFSSRFQHIIRPRHNGTPSTSQQQSTADQTESNRQGGDTSVDTEEETGAIRDASDGGGGEETGRGEKETEQGRV